MVPVQKGGGIVYYSHKSRNYAGTDWKKHCEMFFEKLSSFDGVRLPGSRRHENRLRNNVRDINFELLNKIKIFL